MKSDSQVFIGMSRKDVNRYSLTRVLRHLDQHRGEPVGDGIEHEMHKELQSRNGAHHNIERFGVPWDVLAPVTRDGDERLTRDLSVGTFSQGGATVETTVSASVVPLLRNASRVISLGATVLGGLTSNVSIPRQTSSATAQMLSESGQAQDSTQSFDQLLMSPHRMSATTVYTRQLMLQSSIDVENFIRADLRATIGTKLDSLALYGQGAGSEPQGIVNTPGIGAVAFGGAATFAKVVAFETALANSNADELPGSKLAYLTTPNVRSVWKTVAVNLTGATTVSARRLWEKGDNGDGLVNDYTAVATNQIQNDQVIFGNWPELVIGLFGALDFITNPYSMDTSGRVRVTAHLFSDVCLRHARSFCVSSDAGSQ